MGIKQVSTNELVTDEARKEWKKFMQFHTTVDVLFRDRYRYYYYKGSMFIENFNKVSKC